MSDLPAPDPDDGHFSWAPFGRATADDDLPEPTPVERQPGQPAPPATRGSDLPPPGRDRVGSDLPPPGRDRVGSDLTRSGAGRGKSDPGSSKPPPGPYRPATLTRPRRAESAGRTPGSAAAALVLAVLGFTLAPVVGSLAAIALARRARGSIEREPGMRGRGLVTSALVLGALGLVVWCLIFALMVVGFLVDS